VDVKLHAFETLALDEGKLSAPHFCRINFLESSPPTRYHGIGGWVVSTASLDAVVKRKISAGNIEICSSILRLSHFT